MKRRAEGADGERDPCLGRFQIRQDRSVLLRSGRAESAGDRGRAVGGLRVLPMEVLPDSESRMKRIRPEYYFSTVNPRPISPHRQADQGTDHRLHHRRRTAREGRGWCAISSRPCTPTRRRWSKATRTSMRYDPSHSGKLQPRLAYHPAPRSMERNRSPLGGGAFGRGAPRSPAGALPRPRFAALLTLGSLAYSVGLVRAAGLVLFRSSPSRRSTAYASRFLLHQLSRGAPAPRAARSRGTTGCSPPPGSPSACMWRSPSPA